MNTGRTGDIMASSVLGARWHGVRVDEAVEKEGSKW